MLVHTEHATYADATGRLLASGAVDIARARMTGSSIGLTYDKTGDLLSLLDKVQLHLAPDERGGGGHGNQCTESRVQPPRQDRSIRRRD